jgi:transposase-like protein
MPRRAKKRGSSAKQRGLSHNQVCVPCAVDRNNSIVAMVSGTGKTSTDKVKAVLDNRIAETSVLVTDKESSYRRFAIENNISLIQIKAEQRTFKGVYHIQHINAFHSRLKSFMRPFQGVSTKHLNNYLVWYAWMQMNRELSEESLERNILNSSTSHNFRLLTSEISKKPVLPMAA